MVISIFELSEEIATVAALLRNDKILKEKTMSLIFNDNSVMQYLWDTIEKNEDGTHALFSHDDAEGLWHLGFIDTEKTSLPQWMNFMQQFLQDDGNYLLSEKQFSEIDQFRYKGEIYAPFEASLINEGLYTHEGLSELFDGSIKPSCSLSAADLETFLTEFCLKYKDKNNLIRMDEAGKDEIGNMLELFPSPMRRLELIFDTMIETGNMAGLGNQKLNELESQRSKFSMQPQNRAEIHAQQLHSLLKVKGSKVSDPKKEKEKKGVELKNIKRSRKGVRG